MVHDVSATEDFVERFAVTDIAMDKAEPGIISVLLNVAEPTSVHVVEDNNVGMCIGKQPIDKVTSDESGSTGYNGFIGILAHG